MKKYPLLSFLITSFFIGVFFTLLVYVGIWKQLVLGLSTVHWWMWPIYLVIAFYVTLTLHELGHFIAFAVQKVKLRAIYLTMFVFYKTHKGWRFKIMPKLWVLFGGLVVPDLDLIEDEETYKSISNKFAISLIAAPIVTISFMIITNILFISSLIWSNQYGWIGFISVFNMFTTMLSILYIYTFKLHTQSIFGDFVAYKKIKEDPLFRYIQLSQYVGFRLDQDHTFSEFLWNKSKTLLLENKMKTDIFHSTLLMNYIEGVIYESQPMDEKIDLMIQKLPITNYLRSEHGLMMAYDIVIYLYFNHHVEKAYQLLDKIEKRQNNKINEKQRVYLNKKVKHVTHIAYNDAFLSNKENFPTEQSWIFEPILDYYKHMEVLHKKLPFHIYECPVDLDEEK